MGAFNKGLRYNNLVWGYCAVLCMVSMKAVPGDAGAVFHFGY